MFILNFANNFFDDIFHCHETRSTAVFVDNNGHVHFFMLKLRHQISKRLVSRHKIGGPHDVWYDPRGPGLKVQKQVLHVYDALDVVDALFINRKTGVSRFSD